MQTIIQENIRKLGENRREFQDTFNRPLADFWDNITGFDVISFDEFLGTPDGTSTADYLKQNYGEKAHDLIFSLI